MSIEQVLTWFLEGSATLVMNENSEGPVVRNFFPIAYLKLLWKLLTGIISESTYYHLLVNKLLCYEQKGCQKNSQGTRDHLSINKSVLRNCKR